VCSPGLIETLPVSSDNVNFFAADSSELYRHAEEPIFLFLIIGSESILVHDDNWSVGRAACARKLREHLLDSSNKREFLTCKFAVISASHRQHLTSARYSTIA